MRVLVELFDKNPIENVLGACAFKPDLIVYLCDVRDATVFKESAIYRLFKMRKLKAMPRFYYLNTADPAEIKRVLAAVMKDYPGCVFDFSGGRDLILLLAGAYCIPQGAPAYYIDFTYSRIINIQGCEEFAQKFVMPTFTAEELFALAGASIKGSGHYTHGEVTEAFEDQALETWEIVQRNPKAWADFVAYLQTIGAGTAITTLTVSGPATLPGGQRSNLPILEKLRHHGLLAGFKQRGKQVEITFSSPLHKKCLLNQGIWLELYCYIIAKRSGLFTDVRTSLVVDWDGPDGGPDATKNEIDVFLMKGAFPVFISCKMGVPSPLAVSEIKLLSSKFGGGHSSTVLVTGERLGDEHRALKNRAADVGVSLLDNSMLAPQILTEKLGIAASAEQKRHFL
ncbi:hypothetical protein LJC61_00835 [Ruminococcaceae bacterium OttesenSCG-928-A16]|nr:hypothetical protein [Ruminococcaceae bacterium OttesenSCG-928-A16]